MWPDLDEKLISKGTDLIDMAISIYHAEIDLELRLLRPFVVCWMTGARFTADRDSDGARAIEIRDMVLAQMGPADMVTHNNGGVTILRGEGEQDYNPEDDSDLDEEQREQASKHRLVTEVLYPRNRPAPPKKKKRKWVSGSPSS